ncbi:MNIO family bufferin maturase [endosymbiont of unidentified scaly snail isolate Monju]|uniref:MNIO family bufferin maturase n=1 Tax=endosymbiont of unidentified scaly snail isolate Monju TaxID=1248727 RepID=UPI0003892549|nr:DUF692 domain-containing protein [endosymbiont of unidentified scaly snail isolate Monju]BAN70119.1 conserved hypothetical protein [endosymbiont of unidentified scaly snail isolate Monju]
MSRPFLGFGLGLRTDHYAYIEEHRPDVDWFEILSENYMVPGGKPLAHLDRIRADYPMVMHGVSLSIGSTDPLDLDYLAQLKTLAKRVEPHWISDHLCWTRVDHTNSHDLLPLPYNETAIAHIAERIRQVQDYLGRQILIENLSSYVTYHASEMPEWEFLDEIARRADCLVLLDINNIYVSAHNHHFDPVDYLDGMSPERVMQFHLAGHCHDGLMIIDTHDHPVCDPVWTLYADALRRFGAVSTMIERDDDIPAFPELRAELAIAERIAGETLPVPALQTSQTALRGLA